MEMTEAKKATAFDYVFPILFGLAGAAGTVLLVSFAIDLAKSPNPIGGAIGLIIALYFEAPVVAVFGIIEIVRAAMKKIHFKIEWILMILLVLLWTAFFLLSLITAKTTTL